MKNLEEITNCLERLKDSPIVDVDYHHMQLSSLCDAITFVSSDAEHTIEVINDNIKNDTPVMPYLIEGIQKRIWVIMTIADVINEKVMSNDYTELDNLFYHYRNEE